MKHELETVLFFPSPSCELCHKAPYTLSSLSNIWTDSRIFGSFSVIRRVSAQFLRHKFIYFRDSCFSPSFTLPSFHPLGAALLQGRSGLGGAGALVCSSPVLTLQVERPAQRPGHLLPSPPSRLQSASALGQRGRSVRWQGSSSQAGCR